LNTELSSIIMQFDNYEECRIWWLTTADAIFRGILSLNEMQLNILLAMFRKFPQLEYIKYNNNMPMLHILSDQWFILERCLLEGFNPNVIDQHSQTIMDLFIKRGYTDLAIQLLKYGAKLNRYYSLIHVGLLNRFIEWQVITFDTIIDGLNPVQYAMAMVCPTILLQLLKQGGNIYTYFRGENAFEFIYLHQGNGSETQYFLNKGIAFPLRLISRFATTDESTELLYAINL
jgi:hypothetical protein